MRIELKMNNNRAKKRKEKPNAHDQSHSNEVRV